MKIKVKVHANSLRSVLEKVAGDKYIAYVKAEPEKGRANLELVKLLSKEFFVRQDKIKILTPTSREKIVDVEV